MLLSRIILAAFVAGIGFGPASAAVIGGSVTVGTSLSAPVPGTFQKLDPTTGFSFGSNDFDDPNLYAFDEDQNIVIPFTITVDVGISPEAGDVVASHYVFFDPYRSTSQIGWVQFDADIYGVATQTSTLSASDFLINNLETYKNPTLRGLEGGDSVAIDASDPTKLWINWTASSPGDYVRVFTMQSPSSPPPSEVPLPAGAPLLIGALAILGTARKSRRA